VSEKDIEKKRTYVLEDTEVVLTGRSAIRTLRNNKTDVRFEIKPANNEHGSWTKWVRMADLYVIGEE